MPPAFLALAQEYLDEVARWQRVSRLTGYRDLEGRVQHLVGESLMLLPVLGEDCDPLLDIGSGVGAPGLVLRLARPDWQVTLVESNRRRVSFLRDVGRRLGLSGLTVLWGRAEALARGDRASRFRTVTMRAVAGAVEGCRLAEPFLRDDGRLVVTLGPGARRPVIGRATEVVWTRVGALPWRRRFLIIQAAEARGPGVPRGTRPRVPRGTR